MKKVYVVTAGDYSDYHIEGVFSSAKKANELTSESSHLTIEEYEIDVSITNFIHFWITMKKNGDVSNIRKEISGFTLNGFYRFNRDDELMWIAKADDEKRAIKLTNEKRIFIKLNDCWGDDQKTCDLFDNLKNKKSLPKTKDLFY